MIFEYTRVGSSYTLTGVDHSDTSTLKFSFLPEGVSEVRLRDIRLKPDGRYASTRTSLFKDGTYTPIVRECDGSETICEKIVCEAGVFRPQMSADERAIALSKRITALEEREKVYKKEFSSLYDAVFGKTIF